jgi:WD40 repeat protein
MGEVYKAEDLKLKRTVALKFLPSELLAENTTNQHLLDEAQAAASLNHPNIATIYELQQTDELSYIVMEYIDGKTLKNKIEQESLEVERAIDIAIQIAGALRATHERGLIHCDIKSTNVMLTKEGQVKVLDFGLARLSDRAGSGVVLGTPGYMSPEQARAERLDRQTDIFSLGVILFEMLTGRLPFDGVGALLNNEPASIGSFRDDVPLELESIVRRGLEKRRDERYQTASEMLSDLRRLRDLLDQESVHRELPSDGSLESIPVSPSLRQRLTAFLFRKDGQSIRSLPKGAAFRGLLPFQEADQDRFYGREMEGVALFDLISHREFRFGVLFGESGCGKTSLVKAGLLPRIRKEGNLPIYCRSYRDPKAALQEECIRQSQIKPHENESVIEYLRRVAQELDTRLVIIFDQFEEFFINFRAKREREPFISFVADCYHATSLPIKFLFSIRSDFLYLISSEFTDRIPEPLLSSRLYHLHNFNEDQAREIIEMSARRANLPLEDGLSRLVARDLAVENIVLPSELQIIGEQLQKHRIFTLQEYRRAGGKEPLVHSLLEDVIQASGDRDGAQLLLRSFISEENTRLTLTLDEIVKRTQNSRQRVEQILSLFVQSRLIRQIQEEEPWRYELMHEYLIEKINQITGKVMDATQRANRLFRQYLSSFSVEKRTRIPLGRLWTINRYSDLRRGEREEELLRKSLQWGLLKLIVLTILLSVVTTFAAAALSISEAWEEARLSDGHTAAVRRVAFSPDGQLMVSVGEDAKVIVWDFARRERLATFSDHTAAVTTVSFSPDGKWFATGSDDKTVMVWDATRLERAAVLREHKDRILAVRFSPDGRLLVSIAETQVLLSGVSEESTIVWETGSWIKIRNLYTDTAPDINFSSDSRRLIHPDGKIWDLTTGQQVAGAYKKGIGRGALSPDGTRFVAITGSGIVTFVDMAARKSLGEYRAHRDNGRTVAFSPDGRLVATGAENIILWDVATQTKLSRLENTAAVWNLAFSPDGKWLVSAHSDSAILLWDVAERECVANFKEHSGPVRAVAFSSDGKRIASASEDRSVIIWNAESGRKEAVITGHNAPVVAAVFSPDGKSIVSTDFEGTIIFWDIERQEPHWSIKKPADPVKPDDPFLPAGRCLAVSPDGRWIATTFRVYDSSNGHQVYQFPSNTYGFAYGVAFSSDGRRLFGVNGEAILLWDTERWKPLQFLKFNDSKPIKIGLSPDGKLFVTGEESGNLRLWTFDPAREAGLLGQHGARVKSITFSPEGKEVATASDDNSIALWDVGRKRLLANIGTHMAPVLSVAFSPDGKRLVSGEQDRSVRLYTRHSILWGYRLD